MIQEMVSGSIAVLTRPSVATFEEFEKDNLGAATSYVAIGAIGAAIFGAISVLTVGSKVQENLEAMPMANMGMGGMFFSNLLGALIGFFIYTGIVYFLGRAFGGTGAFGELAYDVALFSVPLTILSAFLNILAIGPLVFLTGLVGFVALLYNFYLTYLCIQSGMNLPGNKALYVMLIIVGVGLVLAICIVVILALAFAALITTQ